VSGERMKTMKTKRYRLPESWLNDNCQGNIRY
jgi:hypothetical protein